MNIRARFFLCALVLSCAFSLDAAAEGNCPPGMFPIHSPGVMGCAPMGPTQAAKPPVNQPRWIQRWGALVTDQAATGINGVSNLRSSQADAIAIAMERCVSGGGKKCKLISAYANACIHVARPFKNGVPQPGRPVSAAGSDREARREALETCASINGPGCEVEYSACSLPVRVDG